MEHEVSLMWNPIPGTDPPKVAMIKFVQAYNISPFRALQISDNKPDPIAQLAGAVEYTNCISAVG